MPVAAGHGPIGQDWPVIRQANSPPALSAEQLASLLSGWADSRHGTLAQQLAHALRRLVGAGVVGDGARLPAERALARALAVSRSTVTAALEELRSEGVVESRQGSGRTVRGVPGPITSSRIAEHFSEGPGVDLSAGNPPDPSHLPPVKIEVADLLADGGGPGVQPLGLAALREALADRYRQDGRITDVAQIHVTAGAHQAISLALGACTRPGDAVALEDPNYPGIFDILDRLGVRALRVPADRAGLLPAALERALDQDGAKVVYLQAGPHNPTGRVPAPGRLRALAEVFDRYDATVVEDTALAGLCFAGPVRPEMADLCRRAVVVSVGSLSKVAWGGLRIGWLRGPAPLVERTMHLRLANDLGASVPAQLLALQLLPGLEELAERRRATLQTSVQRAVERLAADLPTWTVTEPEGGSVLWAALPVADSGPFVQLASRHGVHIAPGSVARVDRVPDPHVRICVDRHWELVDMGLQRLRLAWRELDRSQSPVLG